MSKHRTAFSFTYAASPLTNIKNRIKTIKLKIQYLESLKAQANTNAKKSNINQKIQKYKQQLNNSHKKQRNILRNRVAAITAHYNNLYQKLNIANLERAIKERRVAVRRRRPGASARK